jgi:hypothetical protein
MICESLALPSRSPYAAEDLISGDPVLSIPPSLEGTALQQQRVSGWRRWKSRQRDSTAMRIPELSIETSLNLCDLGTRV